MPEMQQRSRILSTSTSSAPTTTSNPNLSPDPHEPSSIPPWVHLNNGHPDPEISSLLPPPHTKPNTRHYKPPPPTHYKPGRKWDHLRSAEPPLLSAPIADHQLRWEPFMQSGPQPEGLGRGQGRIASAQWMEENMPYTSTEWDPEDEVEAAPGLLSARGLMYRGKWLISPQRQERTVRLFWRLLLKNPFVPLVFRLTVLAFSAAALGIGAAIYVNVQLVNKDADPYNQCAKRASTYMAICVGTVAVPYLTYVTWDEYMSKPLGLRSVPAKILLLLCDLYFVCFSSSNLSLGLDALWDHRWACYDEKYTYLGTQQRQIQATCPNNPSICTKQKALSGVLFVSLIAWCVTFSISVLRVVEKLRPD